MAELERHERGIAAEAEAHGGRRGVRGKIERVLGGVQRRLHAALGDERARGRRIDSANLNVIKIHRRGAVEIEAHERRAGHLRLRELAQRAIVLDEEFQRAAAAADERVVPQAVRHEAQVELLFIAAGRREQTWRGRADAHELLGDGEHARRMRLAVCRRAADEREREGLLALAREGEPEAELVVRHRRAALRKEEKPIVNFSRFVVWRAEREGLQAGWSLVNRTCRREAGRVVARVIKGIGEDDPALGCL